MSPRACSATVPFDLVSLRRELEKTDTFAWHSHSNSASNVGGAVDLDGLGGERKSAMALSGKAQADAAVARLKALASARLAIGQRAVKCLIGL
jgi:hypothetical protein